MKRTLLSAAIGAVLGLGATSAQAYSTFFGQDLAGGAAPLASTPNASAAETSFLSGLTGVGTETFEGIAAGTSQPLVLNFPGAGTATLTGGSGDVISVPTGTSSAGRYSIPSASTTNLWQVSAGGGGNFAVTFTSSIAAFGFYGIDIGDYGGQLTLSLSNGSLLTVPNTVGSNGSTDGSVLYFGFIASNAGEEVLSVAFNTTTGQGDVFGFDNFTIGTAEQVRIPEPSTLALLGLALAGLGAARRRKNAGG